MAKKGDVILKASIMVNNFVHFRDIDHFPPQNNTKQCEKAITFNRIQFELITTMISLNLGKFKIPIYTAK